MNAWERISERLRERYAGTTVHDNWIAPLQLRGGDEGSARLRLVAPNEDVRESIQSEFAAVIAAVAEELGVDVEGVDVEVEPIEDSVTLLPQHRSQREAEPEALVLPGQGVDLAFMHSFLAQIGLPRSRQRHPDGSDIRVYRRASGNCSLLVQSGVTEYRGRVLEPFIPYGPKPRLMLMDICTRAVQTRSPEIDLEPSVRQYLTQRLDVGWGGGRNGQYTIFRKQALALAACSLRLVVERGERITQFQGIPISRFDAWVVTEGEQQPLWPGQLRLSTEFYESLIEHGMPINAQAYRALSYSALAMDVYTFFAHRLHRIDGSITLSWKQLRDAMAPEYAEVRNFRRKFLEAVRMVDEVYPGICGKVQPLHGRVRLYHANAPVGPSSPRPRRTDEGQVITV